MTTRRILGAIGAAWGFLTLVQGATITVDDSGPADFSSIQAALNAATNGDEIVVRPGRYRETLNFLGKAVTVRSERGPSETVVYLEGETRIVLLNGNSTLRGFTITGGRSRVGGGILVTGGAQPVIEQNVIVGNTAARDGSAFPAFGGGIAVDTLSSPVITRNEILGNESLGDAAGLFGYGGAIDLADNTSAVITDNVIAGNRATDSGGGISLGIAGTSTPVDLTNVTVVGNEAGSGVPNSISFGGGIVVSDGAVAAIRNNLVANNVSRFSGGGIYFFATGLQGLTYTSNDFDGNAPDACGGLPASKCNGGQFFLAALFQDPAAGEYRLRSDSPVIDKGATSGAPAVDADGKARSVDGNLDGTAAPDVGAFENQKELTRLRFDSHTALAWDGSSNPGVTFEVYRDDLATLGPGPIGSCLFSGLTVPSASDAAILATGDGFSYLVRGLGTATGSLGTDSAGTERVPATACP